MPETAAKRRASASRRRPSGRSRKIRKWLLFFSILTLFLIGGAVGAVYWKVDSTLDAVTQPQRQGGVSSSVGRAEYKSNEPLSLVILGTDTRPETGSMNTDVMIVAVINPEDKRVSMVSLPRDTRVKIPGYSGYHKINSVYANGEAERRRAERNNEVPEEDGISLVKKTLGEILGIPINHYIALDFEGFKAVIDELGGIEVNVDRRLVYDDPTDGTHINLQPGLQVLNGEQALGYVRHRHDNRGLKYYSSDFDRNRRQQEVIRAVLDKAASLDGLTKVFAIMDVGAKHIRTDLSKEQIIGLAYDFKNFNSSMVTTLENGAYWQGGYTYLDKEKLELIRSTLQAEMGLSGSAVAKLNNSPVLGESDRTFASSGSSSSSGTKNSSAKKSEKKTTESAAPAANPPKDEETMQQTDGGEEMAESELPPPDIVSPGLPVLEDGTNRQTPIPSYPENGGGRGTEAEWQVPAAETEPSQTYTPQLETPPDVMLPVGQLDQIPAVQ